MKRRKRCHSISTVAGEVEWRAQRNEGERGIEAGKNLALAVAEPIHLSSEGKHEQDGWYWFGCL